MVSTAVQDMGTGSRSVLALTVADAFGVSPVQRGRSARRLAPAPGAEFGRQQRDRDDCAGRARGRRPAEVPARCAPRRNAEPAGVRRPAACCPGRRLWPVLTGYGWCPSGPRTTAGSAGTRPPPFAGRGPHRLRLPVDAPAHCLTCTPAAGTPAPWTSPRSRWTPGSGIPGSLPSTVESRRAGWPCPSWPPRRPAAAIIQGIGYALYEQREIDPHTGLVLTAGLEDYRIPGIADIPDIDLHFDDGGFEHVTSGGRRARRGVHHAGRGGHRQRRARCDGCTARTSYRSGPTGSWPRSRTGRMGNRDERDRAGGTDLSERRRSGVSRGPVRESVAARSYPQSDSAWPGTAGRRSARW